MGTAEFLHFGDQLFDSMNGATVSMDGGKKLRCAVSISSEHMRFWGEAEQVLKSIKFLKPGINKEFTPPTVGNFIFTITAIRRLWKNVCDLGYEYLCPRALNQDPLENFFGCIRLQRGRNVNPTCQSFVASFKTLLVNNYMSPHSPGSNCEEDEHDGSISTLREFLESSNAHQASQQPPENLEFDDENEGPPEPQQLDQLEIQTQAYVTGYVVKRVLKRTKCDNCRAQLITRDNLPEHDLINFRKYAHAELTKPGTRYIKLYNTCASIAHFYIPQFCLKHKLTNFQQNVNFKISKFVSNPFYCDQHDLFNTFKDVFLTFYIHAWSGNVNKILKGEDKRIINDDIKAAALEEAKKHRKFFKKVNENKQLR